MKKLLYKAYYKILFVFKNPKKVKLHPRFKKPIKYGFSTGDKHYYRLSHDYDIYENRFRYLKTFYQEVENKLTSTDINEFCQAAKKYINKGEYIEAGQLLDEMEYRSKWLFEPTSLYKYASVIYFDLDEDIRDYDMMYCHKKIEHWSKKKELLRILLKELMENADSLLDLSNNDFNHYISVLQKEKDKQRKLLSGSGLCSNRKSTEVTI